MVEGGPQPPRPLQVLSTGVETAQPQPSPSTHPPHFTSTFPDGHTQRCTPGNIAIGTNVFSLPCLQPTTLITDGSSYTVPTIPPRTGDGTGWQGGPTTLPGGSIGGGDGTSNTPANPSTGSPSSVITPGPVWSVSTLPVVTTSLPGVGLATYNPAVMSSGGVTFTQICVGATTFSSGGDSHTFIPIPLPGGGIGGVGGGPGGGGGGPGGGVGPGGGGGGPGGGGNNHPPRFRPSSGCQSLFRQP